jgi:uncharacterized protein (TIGR02301 family)
MLSMMIASPSLAQSTYAQYQEQLLRMAEIMGSLHQLRSLCDRDENQLWRSNMQRLIEIESPSEEMRQKLVQRFNQSVEQQRRAYSSCNRDATNEIKRLAREGERLTGTLAGRR